MKLVGGDSGRVEHEEFVSAVLLAPSERAVVDVFIDQPGQLTLEHRTPDRSYPLTSITVADQPVTSSHKREFQVLRRAPELAAEREQLDAWLAAPPDKTLALVAEMDDLTPQTGDGPVVHACPMHPEVTSQQPGRCLQCGMKLIAAELVGQPSDHGHIHHDEHEHAHHDEHEHGSADGIEWEHDMVEVNRLTTTANMHWKLVDPTSGAAGNEIDWRFTVGDPVKIRLVNEMDSDHPVHHPFHLLGAS